MPTINSLFKDVNSPIRKENLVRLIDLSDQQIKEIANRTNRCVSHSKVKEFSERLGVSDKDFYYVKDSHLDPFCYYHSFHYFGIMGFEDNMMDFLFNSGRVKEGLKQQKANIDALLKEKQFIHVFSYLNSKISFLVFNEIYQDIPPEQRYKIFRSIWMGGDYGFDMFDKEVIQDVFNLSSFASEKDLLNQIKKVDSDNCVTIYRGVGSQSTPAKEAFSWTTDLCVALKFATRFDFEASIYQGKVHYDKIVDYINNRNEAEILVYPQDIIGLKKIESFSASKIISDLDKCGLVYELHAWMSLIKPIHFHSPNGIHGMLHAKRVLLLVLTISYLENLKEIERNILAIAAVMHDIGRTNDNKDDFHGYQSFKKIKKMNLIPKELRQYTEYIQLLVEQHAISDKEAFANIIKYNVKTEMATKLLRYFKDSDNLDRVRIQNLDPNYLRCSISHKLILYAQQLLQNIKL